MLATKGERLHWRESLVFMRDLSTLLARPLKGAYPNDRVRSSRAGGENQPPVLLTSVEVTTKASSPARRLRRSPEPGLDPFAVPFFYRQQSEFVSTSHSKHRRKLTQRPITLFSQARRPNLLGDLQKAAYSSSTRVLILGVWCGGFHSP